MNMRRWLAALLALAMMLLAAALAEDEDAFGFEFDDEGYTGEWLTIDALSLELCLPDGWTQVEAGEEAAFAAKKDDGTAALAIRVEAEAVEDMVAWGDENLAGYEIDDTGFFDTLIVQTQDAVSVYRLEEDGKVLSFLFTRQDEASLQLSFALEIVDSAEEAWLEDGIYE